jgi:hypothetical protein
MNTLGKLILTAIIIGVTLYWATDKWEEYTGEAEDELGI